MFFRFTFALCLVALFAVAINAEEQTPDVNEVESRSAQGKIVASYLSSIANGISAKCVSEAGEFCKAYWNKRGKAQSCGRNFFNTNRGRCSTGK